jgi:hypothetical protein
MKGLRLTVISLVASLAMAAAAIPAHAFQLITSAEAALPAAATTEIAMRGLTRGPSVDQRSPSPDALTPLGPLTLDVAFEAHNGASVDPGSVRVTYLKDPAVDLTQRLKPYITPTGIKAGDVDVPPGTHMIRIDLTDSQGRSTTAVMKLQVAAK